MNIIFTIFCILSALILNAQESQRLQYNIIVESEEGSDEVKLSYEILNLDDKSSSRQVKNAQQFNALLMTDLASCPLNKRQVLFYIHGMWGGKKFAFNRTYRMLEELYLDNKYSDIARIVSIKWPGNKMEYKVNKKKLYQIDNAVTNVFIEFFNSFYTFRHINNLNGVEVDMIAHSLGTELFKEVICQWPVEIFSGPIIDNLILASPDLTTDVFEKEECFGNNINIANKVTVYFSDRDLTLGVSKNLNDLDRLGRAGPSSNSKIPKNVNFIDATKIKDETNFSDLITGHSSFRASPIVSRDILSLLTYNPEIRIIKRKIVNEDQHIFKLELPNEDME